MIGGVHRVGDTVRRPTGDWTPAVHQLLDHLERVGFDGAPRLLGVDANENEVLTFVEGEPGSLGYPAALLGDVGVLEVGSFIRRFHDAVGSFRPQRDALWRIGAKPIEADEIVCHGDLGHWNTVWRGDRLVAAIDWDFAEPNSPLRDLATAALGVVPFVDDARAQRMGFEQPPDRRHRLTGLCDAYEQASPSDVVDAAIVYLETEAARVNEFGAAGREPWHSLLRARQPTVLRARANWLRANRRAFT